jgi:eukaryotic-like serine/threonine-protein kinase
MNCPHCSTVNPDYAESCSRCGTPMPVGESETIQMVDATALKPGADFGPRYRIEALLGQGGMGRVYKATDKDLDRVVALKVVRQGIMGETDALKRFKQELILASKISHKNILRIHDMGEVGDVKFITMAYVEGQDLHGILQENPKLPMERILKFAVQLAEALAAAHAEGVVHRDLKPQNILVNKDDQIFVSDFGLAKSFEEGAIGMTRTGAFLGTPRYMSPEQVEGKPADQRSDLYAYGLILYELVTGDVPFTGETTLKVMYQRIQEKPKSPKLVNPSLPNWLVRIIMRCLERDPAARYQTAYEILADLQGSKSTASTARTVQIKIPEFAQRRWKIVGAALVVLALLIGGSVYWLVRRHPTGKLASRDTVVLADFLNSTQDTVFDDTLKQALGIQLGQSPFLNVLSDSRVGATLKMMNKPPTAQLTGDVAREVCVRTDSRAVLAGSIVGVGNQYLIGLKAIDCQSGDVIASADAQAENRDRVLKALGQAGDDLRQKLGESLASVERFSKPVDQATTSSLEALKAFTDGRRTSREKGESAALPFYKRALELDPNFAQAYASMGAVYTNLRQPSLATAAYKRAYELRDRVSERERFDFESRYYSLVTGEIDKADHSYSQWLMDYPGDYVPHGNLGSNYIVLGQYEKAVEEMHASLQIKPNSAAAYANLIGAYCSLSRLEDAKAAWDQSQARKLDGAMLRLARYALAFLEHDEKAMKEQLDWSAGKPGAEDLLLSAQSDTEAYFGHFAAANALSERAVDSAKHADALETGAGWKANEALRDAEFGNAAVARQTAAEALAMSGGTDVEIMAGLALARTGDTVKAEQLANKLDRDAPLDTIIQGYWLPTIRGAIALSKGDGKKAVELLESASAYELGQPRQFQVSTMYPIYVRGQAFLKQGLGQQAAVEFQKILDQTGQVVNFPLGSLARLEIGRARAMSGDKAAAKQAYDEFFSLWKDADANTAILKEAKAEYAKL